MISTAAPAFLIAGLAFAGFPIVLHLLARRPPSREPLPTARFLSPDARTLLRLRRRPTDLVLLTVRVLFALALGAAFAELVWTGERTGIARIVLLDAGASPAGEWEDRRSSAQRLAAEGVAPRERVVLAYGLDDGPQVVDPADLDRLQPGTRPATAEDGLRALRGTVAERSWATAEAVWVTQPSWRIWSRGVGLLRASLWPGGVMMTPMPRGGAVAGARGVRRDSPTALIHGAAVDPSLERAVQALGGRVLSAQADLSAETDVSTQTDLSAMSENLVADWVFSESPEPVALEDLIERAQAGSTVVLSGSRALEVDEMPWTSLVAATRRDGTTSAARSVAATPLRPLSTPIQGFVIPWSDEGRPRDAPSDGAPGPGARVIAVFEDGAPAAAARPIGAGCLVYSAVPHLHPALTGSPRYPEFIRTLAEGCGNRPSGAEPLDRGARLALERPDLPATVEASALGPSGYPLTPWLLALTLALFAAELFLTRTPRGPARERSS